MDVSCPQCHASYELDESQIRGDSARVKCSSCNHVFRLYKPSSLQGPPVFTSASGYQGSPSGTGQAFSSEQEPSSQSGSHLSLSSASEWKQPSHTFIVRSEHGVISHIPDQATLQRMIVERKVSPIDELSLDGEQWVRLGMLQEYQPFFQVLVQPLPSQNSLTGPVLLSGQLDPTSTLEFGLPATYGLHPPSSNIQTSKPPEVQHHNTARYFEVISGQSMQELASSSSRSGEDLPFLPSAPVYTSSSNALPAQPLLESNAGTAAYGTSVSTVQANIPVVSNTSQPVTPPSLSGSSSREKLEAIEASIHMAGMSSSHPPNERLMVEPELLFEQPDQRRIPTMITRNSDEWPLGPAVRLPSHDEFPPIIQNRQTSQESRADSSELKTARRISQEELFTDEQQLKTPSRTGRWFLFLVLFLGLGVGSYALLNPSIVEQFASYLGLAESTPEALNQVDEARELLLRVSPTAFQEAKKKLDLAQQHAGKTFAALQATKASLQFLAMDTLRWNYQLLDKKLEHWQSRYNQWKANGNNTSSSHDSDGEDDPAPPSPRKTVTKKNTKNQAKPTPTTNAPSSEQLEKLAKLLQQWKEKKQDVQKKYDETWKDAHLFLTQAQKRNPGHPYTQLAALHKMAFPLDSPIPIKTPQHKEAEKITQERQMLQIFKKIQAQFDDPSIRSWAELHLATFLLYQDKEEESRNHAKSALHQRKHTRWLYPRFLLALSHLKRNEADKAEGYLKEIEKYEAEHPLVQEFRQTLFPPSSLSTLLESTSRMYAEANSPATTSPPRTPSSTTPDTTRNTPPIQRQDSSTTPPVVRPETPRAIPSRPRVSPLPTPSRPRALAIKPSKPTVSPQSKRATPAKKTSTPTNIRSLLKQAYRYCDQGSPTQKKRGLDMINQLLQRQKNGQIYSTAGWCYLHLGRHAQAVTMFHKATQYKTMRPDTYYGMGLAYASLQQIKNACTQLKYQLRRFPRHQDNFEVSMLLKKYGCP